MEKSKKRKLWTLDVKYNAIVDVEKGLKKTDIASQIGIPHNTLSTWIKQKQQIKEAYEQNKFTNDRKKLRTCSYDDVEAALVKWLDKARSHHLPISGPIIQSKAQEFAAKLNHPDFKCSIGWLDRFRI